MAKYRSEGNKFPNKINYKDLNMTLYPNQLDTRDNNINMKGHVNIGEGQIPDFVMAEFVNTLIDGVMAIERTLGISPQVPLDTKPEEIINVTENNTVKDRLDRIENGLFDERYGGKGWIYNTTRPTLNNHNHSGKNGQPGQINLTTDVTGKLPKNNINLEQTNNGLTGSDIYINKASNLTIDAAITDKLSKEKGGTIKGPVIMESTLITRNSIQILAKDIPQNTRNILKYDATATDESALVCQQNISNEILKIDIKNMIYGKYVCSIRLKSSSKITSPLLRIKTSLYNETYSGNDFNAINEWKQFYFVFDINEKTKKDFLIIEKLNTSTNVDLSIDNLIVETIHPSVLDR